MKLLLLSLLVAACSSNAVKSPTETVAKEKPKPQKTVSMESKQLASEQETNLVTEIAFPKEKATVSSEARQSLKDLFVKAKKKGKIDEIKVITWGDQEYPSVHDDDLSEQQQDLVKSRNKAIEKYLGDLDKTTKVETFSMAERPDALQSLFSSEDAQIKKSLETAGIPNTDTSVKVPGKASKSVVIFLMEEG